MSENHQSGKQDKKTNKFIVLIKTNVFPFLKKHWPETLKPIVVLCVVCLVASLLLGITNEITAPIIEINTKKAADELRRELLPKADTFEQISVSADGIIEMYKAANDEGYIITAQSKGYGGMVPVMVAFSPEHQIAAVKFLDNSETPGLGKKVNTPKFENQFANKEPQELSLGNIDAIASATITSSAAVNGINNAINLYTEKVMGSIAVELTPQELRASLLPNAGAITKIDFAADGIIEAYKGESYGTILYAQGEGFYKKTIIAAVAFDNDGVITGVWVDASNETQGVGTQVGKPKYAEQYKGKSNLDKIEAVAGATMSSDAAKATIQKAVDAFTKLKGA